MSLACSLEHSCSLEPAPALSVRYDAGRGFCSILFDGLLVRVQMLATKRKLNFSTYSHFSTIQVTDCMKEVIKQTALRRSLGGLGTGESVLRRVHP